MGEKEPHQIVTSDQMRSYWMNATGEKDPVVVFHRGMQSKQPSPDRQSGDFGQTDLFHETEPEIITIENCQVVSAPVVKSGKGKKEWTCTFIAPVDLWHQNRDELVHARASDKVVVSEVQKKKLQPGDFVTLRGIVTQEQDLVRAGKTTRLTYVNVTEVRPGLRAANEKINGRLSAEKPSGIRGAQ